MWAKIDLSAIMKKQDTWENIENTQESSTTPKNQNEDTVDNIKQEPQKEESNIQQQTKKLDLHSITQNKTLTETKKEETQVPSLESHKIKIDHEKINKISLEKPQEREKNQSTEKKEINNTKPIALENKREKESSIQNIQPEEKEYNILSETNQKEIPKEKTEDENTEFFTNYESDFQKKEKKSIERIEKVKAKLRTIKKTNIIFVASLIWVTAIGTTSIFLLDSDVHNLNNYKANILNMIWEEEPEITNSVTTQPENTQPTDQNNNQLPVENNSSQTQDIPLPNEEETPVSTPREVISKWGYKLEYQVHTTPEGTEEFLFEWQTYSSQEDFDNAVLQAVENKKKDKLKNLILDQYKK